jgi:hypothetical protein
MKVALDLYEIALPDNVMMAPTLYPWNPRRFGHSNGSSKGSSQAGSRGSTYFKIMSGLGSQLEPVRRRESRELRVPRRCRSGGIAAFCSGLETSTSSSCVANTHEFGTVRIRYEEGTIRRRTVMVVTFD